MAKSKHVGGRQPCCRARRAAGDPELAENDVIRYQAHQDFFPRSTLPSLTSRHSEKRALKCGRGHNKPVPPLRQCVAGIVASERRRRRRGICHAYLVPFGSHHCAAERGGVRDGTKVSKTSTASKTAFDVEFGGTYLYLFNPNASLSLDYRHSNRVPNVTRKIFTDNFGADQPAIEDVTSVKVHRARASCASPL